MGRGRLVVRAVLITAVCAISAELGACSDLKSADVSDAGTTSSNDAAGTDGALPTGEGGARDGAALDGALPDAGAPPLDFACSEAWTVPTKTKTECAPRQVTVVEAAPPADPSGVSIATTTAGRVGIVYNSEQGADEGELHLAHFTPKTASYAAPKIVVQATGFAFHNGYLTKIAASAPDTLAVLSYDMDDNSQTGEVHLRSLVAGAEPLTDDPVVTGIANPTEIAVASDALGNTYATYRVSTGATTAKLSAKKRAPAGSFTALPDLTSLLLPGAGPDIGSASLFVDATGQAHLLFHYNEVMQHSTPRYHALAGVVWSSSKTIDNAALDGLAGFSPRIAVTGTKKYAAYYFRKAGQTTPVTADLRLASWETAMDTPVIEVLDQQLPSDDPLAPVYRVAMAVDKYGLVHIAQIRPTSATAGYLEYRRQTRLAGGGTKWLSDIVDPDVVSQLSQAFVDLVVDDAARPHIAYVSGKDGRVRYATRFDR